MVNPHLAVVAQKKADFNNKVTPAPVTTQPVTATNTNSASNIDAGMMRAIQQKALAGQKMFDETPEKIAAYNTFANPNNNPYAPKSTEPSLNDMFSSFTDNFNSMYDARMSSLEKMLQDMMNANKYTATEQAKTPTGSQDAGMHLFDPGEGAKDGVGYTQEQSSMNDSLFKYLNSMWNGGF